MMRQNKDRHRHLFLKIFEKNDTCSMIHVLNLVHSFDTKNHLHKIDRKHPFPEARVPISSFPSIDYEGYADINDYIPADPYIQS